MENHFVKCTQSDYKDQPTLRYDTQCMVLDPFLAGIFVAVVGEAYPYDSKVLSKVLEFNTQL